VNWIRPAADIVVRSSSSSSKASKMHAIKPNMDNFASLQSNLQQNNCCTNVIPLNISITYEAGKENITFQGIAYSFAVDSLFIYCIYQKMRDVEISQACFSAYNETNDDAHKRGRSF
jgi:hypothetical protein